MTAAIVLGDASAEAHLTLGNLYVKRRLYAEALKQYEKAAECDPGNQDVRDAKLETESKREKNSRFMTRVQIYTLVLGVFVVTSVATLTFENVLTKKLLRSPNAVSLGATLREKLAHYPGLENVGVQVSGERSGLIISGDVPSDAHKALVQEVARNVVDDRTMVTSNISISSPAAVTQIPAGFLYTVKGGDTLSGLADRFYGETGQWKRIFEINKDKIPNPTRLVVHQVLVIPPKR